VANDLGSSGAHHWKEYGASDAVRCQFHGDDVIVSWFKSGDALKSFKSLAASAGGSDEILFGAQWAIECTEPSACAAAKAKMGGSIS
jgi:hypothetical protein